MTNAPFYNYATRDWHDVAVEERSVGAWYILPSFAGYNSNANNLWGYATKRAAEAAILRYQSLES